MADQKQVEMLLRSVVDWNAWRGENRDTRVDLRKADLFEVDLIEADLRGADLQDAHLRGARFNRATRLDKAGERAFINAVPTPDFADAGD